METTRRMREAKRVVRAGKSRVAMPVIIRGAPSGYNWGWYSREDPRMHLQTVDSEHRNLYKVWLESKGKRVFEPVGQIPPKILKAVRTEVQTNRQSIEDWWVEFMLDNRWIELHVALPKVTLVAYPKFPSKFIRTIDLLSWFTQDQVETLKPEDITLHREMVSLRLWADRPEEGQRYDVRLSSLLWTG